VELDFLSPAALQRVTDLAMEYFEKQQRTETQAVPAVATVLAEIDKRETEVRDQFKPESSQRQSSKVGLPNSRRSAKRSIVPPHRRRRASHAPNSFRRTAQPSSASSKSSRAAKTLHSRAKHCEPC
jgi:hypothetical protein